MKKVVLKTPDVVIDNCISCPHHKVESDPDPHDSFNNDDVKVRCTLSKATYRGNRGVEPYVTVACRPYRTRQESDVPRWCPLEEVTQEGAASC